MHRTGFLLQLALWVASTQAFYPYFPPPREDPDAGNDVGRRHATLSGSAEARSDGPVAFKLIQRNPEPTNEALTEKVARVASGLARKYAANHPSRTSLRQAGIGKRDNEYSVERAAETTTTNSAGIHQDGSDFSYFIEVGIGSEAKPLYMLLDTGASSSWVMGEDCTSEACELHDSFGEGDSSTYTDTGSTFEVFYGSGSVSGHVIEDSFAVAGLTVTMEFGLASNTSNTFTQFPFDGIMGVSPSDDSFTSTLRDAGILDSNIMGVALSRSADGINDGEVVFGGTNEAQYTGDFSYSSIVEDSSWAISMDDMTVDGNSVGISRTAYIDTGTTYAFGPPDDVEALFSMIEGASSSDGTTYSIPCDSDVPVALTFSGSSWTISSKDLISAPNDEGTCIANIYGMEVVEGAFLLGDVFLKNVYSVFDLDQGQIGFAARATASSGGSSTSAPTPTPMPSTSPSPSSPSNSTMTATSTSTPSLGLGGQETENPAPTETGQSEDQGGSASALASGGSLAIFFGTISVIFAVI